MLRDETDDFSRRAQALQTVGAELEALSQRVQALAGGNGACAPGLSECRGECPRLQRHRAALRAAVQTLERTRSSFKSKELGELRRALESVLFDGPQ